MKSHASKLLAVSVAMIMTLLAAACTDDESANGVPTSDPASTASRTTFVDQQKGWTVSWNGGRVDKARGYVAASAREAVARFGSRFAVSTDETTYTSITSSDPNPGSEVVEAVSLIIARVLSLPGSGRIYATSAVVNLSEASNAAVTDELRSTPEVNGIPVLLLTSPVGWRVLWADGRVVRSTGFVSVEAHDALTAFSTEFGITTTTMAMTGSNLTTVNAVDHDVDAVRQFMRRVLVLPGSGELRVVHDEIRLVTATSPLVADLARQLGSIGGVKVVGP